MNTTIEKYEINTINRLSAFLANLIHESQSFKRNRENLNYSTPNRLLEIYGKRIKKNEVNSFIHNPERLANRVYANRMGNGAEATGDGYRYRGGGYFQLTGKDNYRQCGKDINVDLVNYPELIENIDVAMLSAGWYWDENNLNVLADIDRFDSICDIINIGHITKIIGDGIGYKERIKLYNKSKQILSK